MKYIFLILVIFTSQSSNANPNKWSLDDCINYAIKNSSKKQKQDEQIKINKYNYTEALANLLPSINANSNMRLNYGRNLNNENTYSDDNSFSNSYGMSTSLNLFNGFNSIYKIKFQKVKRLLGKHELQDIVDMLAYETMEAYFNVLYCIEMKKLTEKKLEESKNELNKVRKENEIGLKGYPELAEIEAKEASDSYNLAKRRNLQTLAVIKLKEKMNYPLDEDIELLDYEPLNLVVKNEDNPYDIFIQTKKFNPKALIAEKTLAAQYLSYKRSKSVLYPSLYFGAGYSTDFYRKMNTSPYSPFPDQVKDKLSKYMSFSLSIPIFNRLSNNLQVKASKADLAIKQVEYDEKMRDLYTEIEQAVADMNGQAEEYYYAEKQLKAIEIAHKTNKRKFDEGLINAIELYTSSNRLLQAETEMLNANIMYRLKQKLVNYYKGQPFVNEQ